eukprot:scaffold43909_cov58-Phaeocystis_antarctica.AAC.1
MPREPARVEPQPGSNSTRCTNKKVIKSTNPQRMPPTCRASMPHASRMHTSHAAALCHCASTPTVPVTRANVHKRQHSEILAEGQHDDTAGDEREPPDAFGLASSIPRPDLRDTQRRGERGVEARHYGWKG